MSEIKLFTLLDSLSSAEKRKVQSALQAKGRKGQNPEVLARFFQLCINEVSKTTRAHDGNDLKQRIWKKLCPKEPYNDNRFRKHSFRLNSFIQDFLVTEGLEEEGFKALRNEMLYDTLWRRNQIKALESLGRKFEGDHLEMSRLKQFIAMRDILDNEGNKKKHSDINTPLAELHDLFEIENEFNNLKMSCLKMSCGKTIHPEVNPEGRELGASFAESSDLYKLYWKLFCTMSDLLDDSDFSREEYRKMKAMEFVSEYNEATDVSFRERYLAYRMFSGFLKGRVEKEKFGAKVFLEAILELDSKFAEDAGNFYQSMAVKDFLHLFDRGVGQIEKQRAYDLLDRYLHLVSEELRGKLGMTIQSLYIFYLGNYQEVLDLGEIGLVGLEQATDEEKRLDIRLGLIQMQSRIELSPKASVISLSRWINKCIVKCPSLNNGTKAALKRIVEYSLMLQKRFPKSVMEDHLKKVVQLEDILGLETHKDWLQKRFELRTKHQGAVSPIHESMAS